LVASAEQLTAEIDGSRAGDLPRVERSLKHILDAGHTLIHKSGGGGPAGAGQDVRASILLGSRGVDLPAISSKLDSIQNTAILEQAEQRPHTDIPGFLKAERENAIMGLLEETKKETAEAVERLHWEAVAQEWEADKQRILSAVMGSGGADPGLADLTLSTRTDMTRQHDSVLGTSSLNHTELQYAKKVVAYNEAVSGGGVKPDLFSSFSSLFPEDSEQEISVLWDMTGRMCDLPGTGNTRPALAVVQRARKYLEDAYVKYIKLTVYSNLASANLGGVPGTYHLVRSYLNVRVPGTTPGLDDGLVDSVPVWAFIYFCLRCGDLSAACQAARLAGPGLADTHNLLTELNSSPDGRLSPQTENVVRLQYRRSVRQTTDPYKRAVYCVLAACDPQDEHPEVATSLDDYLWIKLSQVREDEGGDSMTLGGLQTLLTEEYGESHFNASEQPLLYFQVLFLTGQFEAAIDFLFRVGDTLRCHAVHIALVLFENNLLSLPANIQATMISRDAGDKSPSKRLNIARLVMLYVKHFESTDPREALQYFYFLRTMKGGKNENLFMSCVGELVLESREFDLLLGTLKQDGSRSPGLIDRFHGSLVDSHKIIELVAADSEERGMLEDAVRLYDLASKHARVVQLLNKLLAQVIAAPPVPESRRDRLQREAVAVAKRYKSLGVSGGREATATFFLLLDLATFFDLFHAGKHDQALDTIDKIQLVPFTLAEIDYRVASFRMLCDEVRRNIPDILVAAMTMVHNKYTSSKSATQPRGINQEGGKERHLESLREKAKSLITYAGMIPYRLPGDTNARLVQMEVLMN